MGWIQTVRVFPILETSCFMRRKEARTGFNCQEHIDQIFHFSVLNFHINHYAKAPAVSLTCPPSNFIMEQQPKILKVQRRTPINAGSIIGPNMVSLGEAFCLIIGDMQRRKALFMVSNSTIWKHPHWCIVDPYDYYTIPLTELQACGKAQGLDIRPAAQGGDVQIGDMLFIRSGFISTYYTKSPDARAAAALRPHTGGKDDGQRWAGIKQEEVMIDWLHDCYFSAVAGDAPSFEAWPSQEDYMLHEYILALWGMPLGEMFDLEKLAKTCKEKGRWTFFVTSSPAHCEGGVSSHGNALAVF